MQKKVGPRQCGEKKNYDSLDSWDGDKLGRYGANECNHGRKNHAPLVFRQTNPQSLSHEKKGWSVGQKQRKELASQQSKRKPEKGRGKESKNEGEAK
jgi:hypothetical protein